MTATATRSARLKPYQGLRPFGEEDAAFFFGRDVEADVIIANLRASRLTVLYGPSGVGKTSLLRAGVEATLRARAKTNFERLGTPEFVPVVFDAWQDDPGPALSRAIAGEIERWTGEAIEPAGSVAEMVTVGADRTNAALLVILDQFEDLSLYHGEQNGTGAFIVEFPTLVNDRRLRVNFLVSIREDAIAQLDRFKRSIPGLLDTRLRVQPLTGEAAREAITGPISRYNDVVEPEARVEIEDALVDAVLGQVEVGKVRARQSGQGRVADTPQPAAASVAANGSGAERPQGVEASYLQLVMERLWDHEIGTGADHASGARTLRLSTLEDLGGAQTIVREHLKEALSDLSHVQSDTAVDVFQFLVTPSGTKITQGLGTLAAWSGHSCEEVASLLEKLQGDARIIRLIPPEPGAEENRYEIFHDVLAGAVLEWSSAECEKRRLAELADTNARLEREKREAERRAAVERRRRVVAVGLLLLALAGAAAALAFWQSARAQKARADRAKTAATYTGLWSQADALRPTRPDLSLLVALQAYLHTPPDTSKAPARAALIAALDRIRASGARILHGQRDTVTSVALHGQLLASASSDGTIWLWDMRPHTPKLRASFRTTDGSAVDSVAFSPSGTLAAAYADGVLRLWSVGSGQILASSANLQPGGALIAVAFSPNGRWLAAANVTGQIGLWDLAGGSQPRAVRQQMDAGVRSLAFSRDSALLAGAGDSQRATGRIRLWSVATGAEQNPIPTRRPIYGVAFDPSGRELAAGGLDGRILVVDPVTRHQTVLGRAGPAIDGIAFEHGRIAAAAADGTVQYWTRASGTVTLLQGHTGMATGVALSPDGATVASGSTDRTVQLWNPQSPNDFGSALERGGTNVRAVAYSPTGTLAWARAMDRRTSTIEIGDARTGVRKIETHDGTIRSLAFSRDGRLLLSGSAGGTVQLWNVASAAPAMRHPLYQHPNTAINSVAFSPTGPWVAFNTDKSHVWLENTTTLAHQVLRTTPGDVYAVAFNAVGTRLAAGGDGKKIDLWSVPAGTRMQPLPGHTDAVFALAFSPRGDMLASGSADDSVRLWNTSTHRQIGQALTGHAGYVRTVAFARGGQLLVSGSADGTIRIWDMGADADLARLDDTLPGQGYVNALTVSPDGSALVAGNRAGALTRWLRIGLPSSGLTSMVCGLVGRGLSPFETRQYAGASGYVDPCG